MQRTLGGHPARVLERTKPEVHEGSSGAPFNGLSFLHVHVSPAFAFVRGDAPVYIFVTFLSAGRSNRKGHAVDDRRLGTTPILF